MIESHFLHFSKYSFCIFPKKTTCLKVETLGPWCKEAIDLINVIENRLIAESGDSFSRGFPLPFNVETLQAFGALFQIPQYYRKFLSYKTKMLCNYVININRFTYKIR
jgi:hypothetical protein